MVFERFPPSSFFFLLSDLKWTCVADHDSLACSALQFMGACLGPLALFKVCFKVGWKYYFSASLDASL